jgi:hypothetical protein
VAVRLDEDAEVFEQPVHGRTQQVVDGLLVVQKGLRGRRVEEVSE